MVWSQHAGERVPASVQSVYAVEPKEFVEIETGNGTLRLTAEHPVQTAPGEFTRADRLTGTAQLFGVHGPLALGKIHRVPATRAAYNLLVSPGGVYFANGLLVHNKGCFLPETPITLADGSQRPISSIRVGDRVLAFSADGLPAIATVQKLLRHDVQSYLVVRTDRTELHVTEEHPFYVGDGKFKAIEALKLGDSINAYDGQGHFTAQRLLAIERRPEAVTVYNLQVDAPHTYLASGIAVHNKGGGCFAPGTLVATPRGPQPIENISLGDTVLAPQPDGRLAPAEVTGVYLNFTPLRVVRTSHDELRTTDEHPLLSAQARYLPAAELGVGDRLVRADGRVATIEAVTRGTADVPVYTLQVAGAHTFIADGFVVHNKGGGGGGRSYSSSRSSGSRSSGSDGDGSSVIGIIIFCFILYYLVKNMSVNRVGASADEDLDYCFPLGDIEPKAAKTEKLLEFIARTDSTVAPATLVKVANDTFRQLQACWQAREYAPMEPLLMPDLYRQHCDQIRGLRQNHEINRLEDLRIDAIHLVHVNYTDKASNRYFTALITAWLRDSYVDDRTNQFLRGDTEAARFQEFWTFQFWDGQWRLREIEQSREADYLHTENFFEAFTETGRDQVYGETAGRTGPLGPNLPSEVQTKDANIDRLLNFLVVTDKIWNREAMLATARRAFTGVLLAWQDGRPEAFTGIPAIPELLAHFRATNEANHGRQWRVEYRNLCIRKVEIVHVNNRNDRTQDEFTVRISTHAQRLITHAGAMVHQDAYVTPWVEFWTFRRSDQLWLLSEILPAGQGARLVATENTDEGSSVEMLQWYYSKERAT